MKKNKFNAQSGKSLIEILIVLAVGGVLVGMAVTRMTSAQSNMQRQNLAREFKVNLERARFDAVKRRGIAKIIITSATAYNVSLDLNQNGTTETAETRYVSFPSLSGVKILGTNLIFPVTIQFDRFGNTTTINASNDAVDPVFTFCENCTLATATVANSNVISLSPTGTVAMLNGGETLPTFGNPTVTAVNGTSEVNSWLVVTDDNATPQPTPTSTPTVTPTTTPTTTPTATISPSPTSPIIIIIGPTPTGSATPTPTVTPTPTPQPTPTVTPTPTVVYCSSGQKPAQAGCTCKLPMTVRTNGKCQ